MTYYVLLFPTWWWLLQFLYLVLAIIHTFIEIIVEIPRFKRAVESV